MQVRTFGSTGIEVPIIGQGTWKFPEHGSAAADAKKALRAGIDLGMVHIDTAEMYGEAETVIAEAIAGIPREKLFIVSKVLPDNASYKGTIKACEKSLKRLKTDYLDCYLLHWRGSIPLSETMGALEQLVIDGKIKSLGVSNFDTQDLEEAVHSLTRARIACNQVLYNLVERGIERKLIPYCAERFIAVVGYTPFAQRKPPSPRSKDGAALHAVAEKHGASPSQIVLAFLTRHPSLFTIPKAANLFHVKENAAAGKIVLDAEDIATLDAVYPAPARDVPLGVI